MLAQSRADLFDELLRQGYPEKDFEIIVKAFDLAAFIFSGRFKACGTPFLIHGIGTAGILASLREPAYMVAASLIHNLYGYRDFWFGVAGAPSVKRKFVERILGPQIEESLFRFDRFAIGPHSLKHIHGAFDSYDPIDRKMLLLSLAETLEKIQDLEPLYQANAGRIKRFFHEEGALLVEMSRRLGVAMLVDGFTRSLAEIAESDVPDELRRADYYSYFAPPRTNSRCPMPKMQADVRAGAPGSANRKISSTPTNIRLFKHLKNLGYSSEEVVCASRAYQYGITLFTCMYRRNGDPFVNHLVRSAGILASLHVPIGIVIAGLLHPVYRYGNFGTHQKGVSESKSAELQSVVGVEVERLLARFASMECGLQRISELHQHRTDLDELDRSVALLWLAGELADLNSGVEYCLDAESRIKEIRVHRESMSRMAVSLGYPELALEFTAVIEKLALAKIPLQLQFQDNGPFSINPRRLTRNRLMMAPELWTHRIWARIHRRRKKGKK